MLTFCAVLLGIVVARVEEPIALNFNSDLLVRAMGVSLCVRRCIDPFLDEMGKIWHMEKLVDSVKPLCTKHAQAMDCLRKSPSCDTHHIFNKASASIAKICGERAALFDKMRPCLAKYADATAKGCDTKCHGRANLTEFLNKPAIIRAAKTGGNILAVNDNIGGMCSALSCELSCVTTELNKVCPLSGWLMLDILLEPFDSVADLLLNSSPSLKDFISKKLDRRCRFLVQKSEIMKLRKGQFHH
ncbi:unnamed protein product [Nippostrongylus brasiliensis]|uniref:CPG4 domain-containing protein n=1 Tax=Nippostrongylus brasiliensis TaxID=27835 RepID=A0A0N4YNM6_NIPBR|nr:unnamed protein product [Nippostrongylus brasiliensis]